MIYFNNKNFQLLETICNNVTTIKGLVTQKNLIFFD